MKRGTRSIVLVAFLVIAMAALASQVMAHRASELADWEPLAEGEAQVADLVKVYPVTSTVVSGQVFTVGIRVEGAEDLAAYKFDLTYDPTLVTVLDADDGGFIEENSDLEVGFTRLDRDTETVHFEAFGNPPGDDPVPGASGSGRLAVLTLKALAVGEGPLTLGNVRVYDVTEGVAVPPAATADGAVVVGACQDLAITALEFETLITVNQPAWFTPTVTGSPPFTYTWDFGDGSALESGVGLAPIAHTYDTVGTYPLTLTVQNVCPSQDSYTTTVGVQGEPDIVVIPISYTLQTNVGETFNKPLTIANEGDGDLGWELEEEPAVTWLTVAPLDGVVAPGGADALTLSFDATGLAAGETVTTTLVINSNDPDEDPVEVPISLEAHEDGDGYPDIEVTPLSLAVAVDEGSTSDESLTIANVGGDDLIWDLEEPGVDWLDAAPMGGTVSPSGSNEVALSFDASDLTAGETYTTTLVINSNDPNEDPVEVPVELEVREVEDGLPDIEVTPLSFAFEANVGETFSKPMTIANVGDGELNWDLDDPDVTWLSAAPLAGTLAGDESEEVTLLIDASDLESGTVSTTLTINSNDPDEALVEVEVELVVYDVEDGVPDIEVTPLSFVITASLGQVFEELLTVANVGGEDLTWDLEDPGVDWLGADPQDGTVAPAGSDEVTLSFSVGGLTVGETYYATLIINSNDPNEDTVEVPVELTVEKARVFMPLIVRQFTP